MNKKGKGGMSPWKMDPSEREQKRESQLKAYHRMTESWRQPGRMDDKQDEATTEAQAGLQQGATLLARIALEAGVGPWTGRAYPTRT